MKVLPAKVFSRQAPYDWMIFLSGSERRVKGREKRSVKFWWLVIESLETPIISIPILRRTSKWSRNAHASVVQPGVLSRG